MRIDLSDHELINKLVEYHCLCPSKTSKYITPLLKLVIFSEICNDDPILCKEWKYMIKSNVDGVILMMRILVTQSDIEYDRNFIYTIDDSFNIYCFYLQDD